jgi:tetratricopeptide (TPR) repeat protein
VGVLSGLLAFKATKAATIAAVEASGKDVKEHVSKVGDDVAQRILAVLAQQAGPQGGLAALPPETVEAVIGRLAGALDTDKEKAVAQITGGDFAGGVAALEALARREEAMAAEHRTGAAETWREVGTLKAATSAAEALVAFGKARDLDAADFWTHVMLARLFGAVGRLPQAAEAAGRAMQVAGNDRDRSVALNEEGDVLVAQGDLPGALTRYEEGLVLARRLAAADPTHTERACDVVVSLANLGDVAVARGDRATACRHFREARDIIAPLAARSPDYVEWQQDLAQIEARLRANACP